MRFLGLGVSEFRVSGCFCLSGFWLPRFRVSEFRGSGVEGFRLVHWFKASGFEVAVRFSVYAFSVSGKRISGFRGLWFLGFWV